MSSPIAKRAASSSPAYSPPTKKAKAAPKPKAVAPKKKTSTSTNAVAGPSSSSSSSSSALAGLLSLPLAILSTLPQETLVENVQTLQAAYLALQGELGKEQGKKAVGGAALTSEQVKEKGRAFRDVMVKGIEKQMKWQPSCKTGRTKWNYSAVVPSEAVFLELFNLVPEKKQWKVKKIPKDTFENLTGSIYASIRYGSLQITSPDITLKWNKEDLTYTVSGLYGL